MKCKKKPEGKKEGAAFPPVLRVVNYVDLSIIKLCCVLEEFSTVKI